MAPKPKTAKAKAAKKKPAKTKSAKTKSAKTKPAKTKPAKLKPAKQKPTPAKPAKQRAAKVEPAAAVTAGRLIPPPGGAVIRMYRIGHGDCFLLAFEGKTADRPAYVLVDCGYKPGSPAYIDHTSADEIVDDLRAATGGHLDVAVITHEHQDHVNGISAKRFAGVTIGEAWFAWTEDPKDAIANQLREKHHDQLLGLLAARRRLAAAGDAKVARRVEDLLAFELGGTGEVLGVAAVGDLSRRPNKRSMKVFKDKAKDRVRFLRPHHGVLAVPGAATARVFALGPPRDPKLLESLNPEEGEDFHLGGRGLRSLGSYFAAAVKSRPRLTAAESPFADRYALPWKGARQDKTYGKFFTRHYGVKPKATAAPAAPYEVPPDAPWRRIDTDWLRAAEGLALDMNDYTNNSSLVLAFELGKGGKVLLFAADAQRGSWVSWAKKSWKDGKQTVAAKDLLARTVLYKVGHHGSHNATLSGRSQDAHANLAWMGTAGQGGEFTAMITAVRAWAETQNGWDHPLKAIKDALLVKCSGRVFQTDTAFEAMKRPDGATPAEWSSFQHRTTGTRLYFDYVVEA